MTVMAVRDGDCEKSSHPWWLIMCGPDLLPISLLF
jgi:hypothetical protein